MTFQGMPVLTSEWLTDPEQRTVRRTWRERLFTRPWRPWVATKTITVQVPSTKVLILPGPKVLMHPAQVETLRRALEVVP